jgi:hypothetical protein
VDEVTGSGQRPVTYPYEDANEYSSCINGGEFLD